MDLATSAHPPDDSLEWRVHLAASQPTRAAVVVGVIGLVAGLAARLWPGPLLPFGVALALLNTVAEFLLPIAYRLTPEGAEMRCFLTRRVIAWSSVRRAYLFADGVKLSPLERRSRRDAFRGVFLRFGADEVAVLGRLAAIGARFSFSMIQATRELPAP